ncbi:bis(5'-nucleosyl)-tetraphosphatase PrpE [Sporosarcina thermotolerans]|uniref:Bis(5'-nucleosyl)-tetraphosphatase PrpE n=1 Tax=Sporosarcina thermotolerans TaxID=633404 RepID=A0AAW9A7M6_9BACL|nr:bis(5'-nucleosyl)-tetraphosphatase PrpE [Sporosarcina thermotolerans]MDW0117024.1 bis(5'-nucleosyl)-tetraphosphatase PrpE [Sporosarcina thermotolerans]WHT47874.1 bis(5'-nucleosyl)-tetraphosphatase PrpE [Sporosarcina thermotolerans]
MKLDIIGDIHGCYDELLTLINKLGYTFESDIPVHKERQLAFVGDAMDRGPSSVKTLELMFKLQDKDRLIYSPGNHCNKLYRLSIGRNVQQTHGLETTVAELNALPPKEKRRFLNRYKRFYEALPLYANLDDGKIIIAHAGIREQMIGEPFSKKIKSFVLYGDTTGETLPDGRPVRRDWAKKYHGDAWIVYGHTPVLEARFMHRTVNVDTGCVFGGKLTAIRYPEMDVVSVPSSQPFIPEKFTQFD